MVHNTFMRSEDGSYSDSGVALSNQIGKPSESKMFGCCKELRNGGI